MASPAEVSLEEDPAAEDSSEDDSPEEEPDEEDSLEEELLEEELLEEDSLEGGEVVGDPLEEDEQPDIAVAVKSIAASKALGIISSRRSTAPVLRFLATLSP